MNTVIAMWGHHNYAGEFFGLAGVLVFIVVILVILNGEQKP